MKKIVIDGENIESVQELHNFMKELLHFPEHYGKNLDALYDCLTDMPEYVKICIRNVEVLKKNLGSKADGFIRVLKDVQDETGKLNLIMEEAKPKPEKKEMPSFPEAPKEEMPDPDTARDIMGILEGTEEKIKIVILDGGVENPGDLSWAGIESLGDLTVYERTDHSDKDEIIRRIGDAEAVIINKVPLTAEIIEACPSIKYIGVLATGYNVVDVEAAAKRGIPVTNVPSYGTETVAQYTFALLLEICSHVGHHAKAVADGRWSSCPDFCFWDFPMLELYGKTFGVIGAGRIGQAAARIAQSFGMEVLYNSRSVKPEMETQHCRYASLDELLANADIVSLHCPLFPETAEMIRKENIDKMKDGAILINTSRGGLVNEQDLADALKSGKISAAAVDVVSTEPIKEDNVLLTAPNCMITPHVAWAAKEARARLMDTVVRNLASFLKGKTINAVNMK